MHSEWLKWGGNRFEEMGLKCVVDNYKAARSWCCGNCFRPCMRKSAISALCAATILTISFLIYGLLTGTLGSSDVQWLLIGLFIFWVGVIYAIYSSKLDKLHVEVLWALQEHRNITQQLETFLARRSSPQRLPETETSESDFAAFPSLVINSMPPNVEPTAFQTLRERETNSQVLRLREILQQ